MSGRVRRRRALVLLSLALASGGLAASEVSQRVQAVEASVGTPVPVVVARKALRADQRLGSRELAVREVPARFAPADALARVGDAAGLRTAVAVAPGSYLTAGHLQGGRGGGGSSLRAGQRALELSVAGGEALAGVAGPGTRVDVLVSTEARDGQGRTFLALERVELLGLRASAADAAVAPGPDDGGGAADAASAVATLRVSPRQAVYLTAAQNFAREIRLLPRPPGDDGRLGRAGVSAGEL